MKTYNLRIKERGNAHILTPSYSTSEEMTESVARNFLINFYGLNMPDIEWYEIIFPRTKRKDCQT